jgi:Asp-tRNA(Asn)/Glu-tRNA(Gln) amidotransferase A subunit family amidase
LSQLSEELTLKTATELADLIRSRAVSPVEVISAHLERVERINPTLNAIVTLADNAMDLARAADAELMRGGEVGALHGVPLTIKDTIDTAGLRTTSGSRLLSQNIPERDATVVARLKAAGAIILGKTNTPEMAIPYETDNQVFGRTNNPHDPKRTPGGSSGGEAAAIAACLSPAGLGSDLSGSIRVPAHFCGIVGLKPTTGRVPMDGHRPAATGPLSLGACIGPMARSVNDLALLLKAISNPTPYEAGTRSLPDQESRVSLAGLRVAAFIDKATPVTEETEEAIKAAARALSDAGAKVSEETPPGFPDGSELWIELFSAAARHQLRDFYRGSESKAGPLVSTAIQRASADKDAMENRIERAEALAAALVKRERRREDVLRWMKKTPLILMPAGAAPAFVHGASRMVVRDQSVSIFRAFSYTHAANVFGLPAAVISEGRSSEGLPIGVQIVGRPFDERTVLAAAAAIEAALGGWQRPPTL